MTAKPFVPASWRAFKRAGRPTVFTIPSATGFIDALSAGLRADAGDDPLSLARMTVLLPTRRACRALREAFLRDSGDHPVLLPRLVPLNDIDEDEALLTSDPAMLPDATELPPPLDPLRRQMMLARMILARDGNTSPAQAVMLARELARLLDRVQNERLTFEALSRLAPDSYAAHWQETITFLEILTKAWPTILAEAGCSDPVDHRNRVFALQAAAWRAAAAEGRLRDPIIAAGSTGSIPATADLLDTIAHLPTGCVVLPGLDQGLDDEAWAALDDTHPQMGLKHLLARFDVSRDAVMLWPGCAPATSNEAARLRLVSELMRPAETTEQWTDLALPSEALAGLDLITAATPRQEAAAIAMVMREALERPEETCALVTPDRDLATRVSAELMRWNIAVDDSAGRELAQCPVGTFLRLIADMVAGDFAPLPLLAVCKHPLAAARLDPAQFRELTRLAEIALLRGPRPAPGLDNLRKLAARLRDQRQDVESWVDRLDQCSRGFIDAFSRANITLPEWIDAHMRCAEALAASHDRAGPLRLWAGDDGESAAALVAQLVQVGDIAPPISCHEYPAVFTALLMGRVVRPRFGRHPRLSILGPLEARLQRFNTLILAGLNEGTWPGAPAPDPWMSRPMAKAFGLPSPERRIGLSAHDVAEGLCAPRVVLTRSDKVDGTPTVPSRWLRRLDQVIAAAGLTPPWKVQAAPWAHVAEAVTRPDTVRAWPAPAPCPPVAARPRTLSVTRIEDWMRDPYGIYASHILSLAALDPLDAEPSAADFGIMVHKALQVFVENIARTAPDDYETTLIAIGQQIFDGQLVPPAVKAFWGPRFRRVARWIAEEERVRRSTIQRSAVEIGGRITFQGPAGPFVLTAKADRIDQLKDGTAVIIDYKTGTPPKTNVVAAGFAPQLPLEAAILQSGGFPDLAVKAVQALLFWHLHGRHEGAEIVAVDADVTQLAAEAHAGVQKLIATFDQPETVYQARPHPAYAPRFSDYAHLARVKEWAASEESDS
ncbi:MAG: double-strand break repair protein AddB [Rhodospirillaceae bacterium]|nr:double-strand break repair protein AddB [Rhodospirillaceae bacterium]